MTTAKPTSPDKPRRSSRDKVRAHRARMRAKGLRPVTVWALDSRSPDFNERVHQSIEAILRSERMSEEAQEANAVLDQAFEDIMAETPSYDWGDGKL